MPSADSIISPLIKIVVTFATLAAVYLFIVKPILDTTDEAFRSTNETIRRSLQQTQQNVNQAVRQAGVPPQRGPGQVQITRTIRGLTPQQAQALSACVQRAGADIARINACFARFSKKGRGGKK